jgi:AraC family transcriptional regulator of adaptative response/methylated-DNA-[protein]-cysteine methyltransferase
MQAMMTMPTTTPMTTDDERYEAMRARDAAWDGRFFTCVHTTGIYCRPSCPARHPHRQNLHYVSTAAEARREGYRPCKRCRPDDALGPQQHRAATVAAIADRIAASDEPLSLDALAAEAGMSRFHFHRTFRELTGVTPKAYQAEVRRKRMQDTLAAAPSVTHGVYDAGFAPGGRFYATAQDTIGMTPRTFRNGGAGMTIHAAIGRTSLGPILVAATGIGLCAIQLGGDDTSLMADLHARFPKATFVDPEPSFIETVDDVVASIEDPTHGLPVPLDIRGTAFQVRVWQALREIPRGETVTYGELARRIGSPGAARAVGTACRDNRLAVAVPCHRVVGADGSLTGYRWGTDMKRALLEREGALEATTWPSS